jgi:hypothetical protein
MIKQISALLEESHLVGSKAERQYSHGCVGFLRSAGPRGFTAYNADGTPIGMFQDKAAAVEAIRRASRPIKITAL